MDLVRVILMRPMRNFLAPRNWGLVVDFVATDTHAGNIKVSLPPPFRSFREIVVESLLVTEDTEDHRHDDPPSIRIVHHTGRTKEISPPLFA